MNFTYILSQNYEFACTSWTLVWLNKLWDWKYETDINLGLSQDKNLASRAWVLSSKSI